MSLLADRCPDGHITVPRHPRCPTCGAAPTDTIDLSDRTATVVTWTVSTATPPGVRSPNPLAIVEFSIEDQSVRAIGQTTTPSIETGGTVRPVHVDQLRDDGGLRARESQPWDGYRFEPV